MAAAPASFDEPRPSEPLRIDQASTSLSLISLPLEMLDEVLKYFPPLPRLRVVSRVCKLLRRAVLRSVTSLGHPLPVEQFDKIFLLLPSLTEASIRDSASVINFTQSRLRVLHLPNTRNHSLASSLLWSSPVLTELSVLMTEKWREPLPSTLQTLHLALRLTQRTAAAESDITQTVSTAFSNVPLLENLSLESEIDEEVDYDPEFDASFLTAAVLAKLSTQLVTLNLCNRLPTCRRFRFSAVSFPKLRSISHPVPESDIQLLYELATQVTRLCLQHLSSLDPQSPYFAVLLAHTTELYLDVGHHADKANLILSSCTCLARLSLASIDDTLRCSWTLYAPLITRLSLVGIDKLYGVFAVTKLWPTLERVLGFRSFQV